MSKLQDPLKNKLGSIVENMGNVGFVLGRNEQLPKIKGSRTGFTLSFLMPKGSVPGDTVRVPVNKGTLIVIQIPVTTSEGPPKTNEYLKNVPIERRFNSGIYDKLKKMSKWVERDVNTKFTPTYIKANEYVGSDSQRDLNKLVKPGEDQEYFIIDAKIIPQNGEKYIFKQLTSFNKKSKTLVLDIYVVVGLNLKLRSKSHPSENLISKARRYATDAIMNGPRNCPGYMEKVKTAVSGLKTPLKNTVSQLDDISKRIIKRGKKRTSVRVGGKRRARKPKKTKKTRRRRKPRARKTRRIKRVKNKTNRKGRKNTGKKSSRRESNPTTRF